MKEKEITVTERQILTHEYRTVKIEKAFHNYLHNSQVAMMFLSRLYTKKVTHIVRAAGANITIKFVGLINKNLFSLGCNDKQT